VSVKIEFKPRAEFVPRRDYMRLMDLSEKDREINSLKNNFLMNKFTAT